MLVEIPGWETIEITDVIFDFNGTLAVDGKLIEGVADAINELAGDITFHIITADTFGSVERELAAVDCSIMKIEKERQDESKLKYLLRLGKENCLCVGNGRNDRLMLKEARIGIALVQEEGAYVESLLAADIVCKSVMDVFAYFRTPDRLKATLRN